MNLEYKDMPYYPSRLPGSMTRHLFQLDAGALIKFQNRPWRIIEINERPFDIWPEGDQQRFHASPEGKRGEDPATWIRRTVAVLLQPDRQPKAKVEHYGCPFAASLTVLPEHYALCHICGELPPCRDALIDVQVEASAQAMDRMMAIPAGCCLGCGEPVTSRMKAHRFPGPNLWRPDLGDDSAVFHARKTCFDQAFYYDEKWAEAVPGRRRRFQCEGQQIMHRDGTMECTEGDGCPEAGGRADWTVHHRAFTTHRPGVADSCWCVSGDLAGRIEQQMRDGETP